MLYNSCSRFKLKAKMKTIAEHSLFILTIFSFHLNSKLSLGLSEMNFFPNLPVGNYHTIIQATSKCNSMRNHKNFNEHNLRLSKKSSNSSEIIGNITTKIAFDDRLSNDINLAIKDSIGGWKDNAFTFKSPRACSTLKAFLGKSWKAYFSGFGYPNMVCPIPAGVYVAKNLDTSLIQDYNATKQFFYGTYKCRFSYTRDNDVYGCFIFVVDIKRPWE